MNFKPAWALTFEDIRKNSACAWMTGHRPLWLLRLGRLPCKSSWRLRPMQHCAKHFVTPSLPVMSPRRYGVQATRTSASN
jgi:hypothetical protein